VLESCHVMRDAAIILVYHYGTSGVLMLINMFMCRRHPLTLRLMRLKGEKGSGVSPCLTALKNLVNSE
jgi:hypothetical protein